MNNITENPHPLRISLLKIVCFVNIVFFIYVHNISNNEAFLLAQKFLIPFSTLTGICWILTNSLIPIARQITAPFRKQQLTSTSTKSKFPKLESFATDVFYILLGYFMIACLYNFLFYLFEPKNLKVVYQNEMIQLIIYIQQNFSEVMRACVITYLCIFLLGIVFKILAKRINRIIQK